MCSRIAGPASTIRLRIPGASSSSRSIASATVAASTSQRRGAAGNRAIRERGRMIVAMASVEDDRLDAPDRWEMVRDERPCDPLVLRTVELPGARPEVDAGRVVPVDREGLAQHAHEGVLLGQPI